MKNPPHVKITVSLAEADKKLIDELMEITGAYTVSEVVRDALRQTRRILRETQLK
jgi:Arc/MetJ-type ribon-helix-helix transcriptional regulator